MRLRPTQVYVQNELKPFRIPEGFVMVRDTREQKPLFADPPEGLQVITGTLLHGDYSIRGFETKFAIERKQMSDFYVWATT